MLIVSILIMNKLVINNELVIRKILHRDVSPTCRMCSVGLETVDHIVAGCSALAPTDYTDRHNQVASIIHWDVCRHFGDPLTLAGFS